MDESPKQLIGETKAPIKMSRGTEKRYVKITERKTKKDWAEFIREVADKEYPHADKITLVMDNLNTHKASSLYEAFPPEEAKRIWDRFEFVYTPEHGSWLNMAEIELNVLNGQCLNRKIDNSEEVQREVDTWKIHRNNMNAEINWRFETKDARIKLKWLYPSINT